MTSIRFPILSFALLAALVVPRLSASADEASNDSGSRSDEDSASAQRTSIPSTDLPKFVPRNRGAPKTRLGGATRGLGPLDLPAIEAWVPEEPGLTQWAKPTLYWKLAEPTSHRIDLRLVRLDPIETLVETTLKGPFEAGVHRVRLGDHGVSLEPGVSYQWFVSIVPDPKDRTFDRMVGGGIERVKLSEEMDAKIASTQPERLAFVLAESGIWYDALDALSEQIAANPGNAKLLAQRAALLEQVGLSPE